MKNRNPYVYVIHWTKNNRGYIGRRTALKCDPSEFLVSYFTSSKKAKNFIQEYGFPDIIQIIETNDCQIACELENHLHMTFDVINSEYWLNENIGGKYFISNAGKPKKPFSDSHKKNISKSAKSRINKPKTEITKSKMRESRIKFLENNGPYKHNELTIQKLKKPINNKVFRFKHPIFGLFEGTVYELRTQFNLHKYIHSVTTGKRKSCQGWSLE